MVQLSVRSQARARARRAAEAPLSKEGGSFRDRYLLSIAALVALLNILNTSGESFS